MEIAVQGESYFAASERERDGCSGCAFSGNGKKCWEANQIRDCMTGGIIWLKRTTVEPVVQNVPKDKQVEYSFEDKLRELLQQEASKGRLVESISVRTCTVDGKPTVMHIEYESHGA